MQTLSLAVNTVIEGVKAAGLWTWTNIGITINSIFSALMSTQFWTSTAIVVAIALAIGLGVQGVRALLPAYI